MKAIAFPFPAQASYEAINLGVQKQEFIVGREMAAGQIGAQFGGPGSSGAGGPGDGAGPSGNKRQKISK